MKFFSFLFIVISAISLFPQESKVIETGIIASKILNEDMKYSIYLPAGYEESDRFYPVVYLLHGRTDDHRAWIQFGEMRHIVDKAIAEGVITPMIIVMPDAKLTYYMNRADGSYSYEDYFITELIPYIEKNFRCRSAKEYRALSGLSMGGYGSLLYSMHHPDMFAACAALSAGVRTDEEIINMTFEHFSDVYGKSIGEIKDGPSRLTSHYKNNNIFDLVANMPEDQKNKVRFYMDCGDGDFLYKGNSALHVLMTDKNIPHEYRVRDGVHEWEYWRTGLPEALKFITKSFHR